jgi:hypothetical protein
VCAVDLEFESTLGLFYVNVRALHLAVSKGKADSWPFTPIIHVPRTSLRPRAQWRPSAFAAKFGDIVTVTYIAQPDLVNPNFDRHTRYTTSSRSANSKRSASGGTTTATLLLLSSQPSSPLHVRIRTSRSSRNP